MIKRIIILNSIVLLFQITYADSTDVDSMPVRTDRIAARLNVTYVPVNSIDFTNRNVTYDVYDNVFYRLAFEYYVSGLLAVGPSIELMIREIEPDVTSKEDITVFNFLVDSKLVHNLVDSGSSKMIFGFGVGFMNLKKENGQSGTGNIFYVSTGLDIGLSRDVGLDLIYRYQLAKTKIEYREYRYNGSAIQVGLNYRIKF